MEAMGGNMHRKDELAKLLRYESSALEAGELTSLEEYTQRMKEDQRYIFFLPSKTRQQALSRFVSPTIKNNRRIHNGFSTNGSFSVWFFVFSQIFQSICWQQILLPYLEILESF